MLNFLEFEIKYSVISACYGMTIRRVCSANKIQSRSFFTHLKRHLKRHITMASELSISTFFYEFYG